MRNDKNWITKVNFNLPSGGTFETVNTIKTDADNDVHIESLWFPLGWQFVSYNSNNVLSITQLLLSVKYRDSYLIRNFEIYNTGLFVWGFDIPVEETLSRNENLTFVLNSVATIGITFDILVKGVLV